jgi:hypothetical protein
MNKLFIYAVLTGGLIYLFRFFKKSALNKRKKLIDSFRFPQTVKNNVRQAYPHLSDAQTDQVMSGLKAYFHICNMAGDKMVSMPSQVVDVAWHEFILFTKQYQLFCNHALGRFLHHVPAEAMTAPTLAQRGIKLAWRLSCKRENINPNTPLYLPLLFKIDAELNIPNGFYYSKDCKNSNGASYCAGDIGCSSGCMGGGDSGGDGDSSGCGGGCGGGD